MKYNLITDNKIKEKIDWSESIMSGIYTIMYASLLGILIGFDLHQDISQRSIQVAIGVPIILLLIKKITFSFSNVLNHTEVLKKRIRNKSVLQWE